jgi:nicotinate-nucleotide adenylyltransferase
MLSRREQFDGKCDVLGFWNEGEYLFENQKFLIIPRRGINMNTLQLPSDYKILDVEIPEISSTDIRNRIKQGKFVNELTECEIVKYIQNNKMYQK